MNQVKVEKIQMKMPSKTKASIYAQMARNQFDGACVLANSIKPQIQSIIWLQMAYFSVELSVKAYLIGANVFTKDTDLKKKVGHNFSAHLKTNPAVKEMLKKTNDLQTKEFFKLAEMYQQHKLRYLSVNLVLKGIYVEDKKSLLVFLKSIIEANTSDFILDGVTGILNH